METTLVMLLGSVAGFAVAASTVASLVLEGYKGSQTKVQETVEALPLAA